MRQLWWEQVPLAASARQTRAERVWIAKTALVEKGEEAAMGGGSGSGSESGAGRGTAVLFLNNNRRAQEAGAEEEMLHSSPREPRAVSEAVRSSPGSSSSKARRLPQHTRQLRRRGNRH
jgi:hypothetical protein